MKTIEELDKAVLSGKLRISHTSRSRGYVSRKSQGHVNPYKGKFGSGYSLLTPAFDSSQYCFVTYYIEL